MLALFKRASIAASITVLIFSNIGCGGGGTSIGGGSPPPPPTPSAPALTAGGAQYVYVAQGTTNENDSILQFSAGANGSVSPSLTLPIHRTAKALTIDASGQLYVGGTLAPNICDVQVFAAGFTSTSSPLRNILLPGGNNCSAPTSISVDSTGTIYVATEALTIYVYSSTASGLATPLRTIYGASAGLVTGSATSISALTTDSAGVLYAAINTFQGPGKGGSIAIFAAGANGNIAPTKTITSANLFDGVAVDSTGTIYASNQGTSTGQVDIFASTASGAATPQKTIVLGTASNYFYGVQVDAVGNIYVLESVSSQGNFFVAAVPGSASGTVSPVLTTTSSSWSTVNSPMIAAH